jgi:hypothetical protein
MSADRVPRQPASRSAVRFSPETGFVGPLRRCSLFATCRAGAVATRHAQPTSATFKSRATSFADHALRQNFVRPSEPRCSFSQGEQVRVDRHPGRRVPVPAKLPALSSKPDEKP